MYAEKCLRCDGHMDDVRELSKTVLDFCTLMAKDLDKIREKYWEYEAENFKYQMGVKLQNVQLSKIIVEPESGEGESSEGEPLSSV